MSNSLEQKAQTLSQMLAQNRLTKIASDQEIKHTSVEAQDNLGKEQTKEVNKLEGTIASTEAAANNDKEQVETPPNNQNLNTDAKAALSATGTAVNVMEQDGTPTTLKTEKTAAAQPAAQPAAKPAAKPAEQPAAPQTKTAADYVHELAVINVKLKQQAMQKQAADQRAAEFAENFRTGTEVMEKIAKLSAQPTEAELAELRDDMVKIAATNPLFNICRDHILMQKLAADADALAEAEGMSPEEAAAQLDAAAAANPEMMAEAEDEANGEALAQLADAEAGADELSAGIQQLADNASANLGQEVTADDIMGALDEVQAQADAMGVPAEALIQVAMDELQGGGDGVEVTPEDEANAQAILEEAAANGVSPDDVIQMASSELAGGEGEGAAAAAPTEEAAAAAPAEEAAAAPAEGEGEGAGEDKKEDEGGKKEDEGEKKEASYKKAATPRAAFVQSLIHAKK